MSESEQKDAHMVDRAERAARIIEQPEEYKICDGCDSILTASAVTCPNCHSYRFDADPQVVAAHARFLASRAQKSITREDMY